MLRLHIHCSLIFIHIGFKGEYRCESTWAVSPFPINKFQTFPKLKEFAVDNFKIAENGKKFFNQVECTVVKEDIPRYEQVLFFPQCFQKTCTVDTLKQGFVWERVNPFPHNDTF